jgi:hypothetical protein
LTTAGRGAGAAAWWPFEAPAAKVEPHFGHLIILPAGTGAAVLSVVLQEGQVNLFMSADMFAPGKREPDWLAQTNVFLLYSPRSAAASEKAAR